jgi:hypothetical protein
MAEDKNVSLLSNLSAWLHFIDLDDVFDKLMLRQWT